MRVTKREELRIMLQALESLRRVKHSRIMRSKAEVGDAREYVTICALVDRTRAALCETVAAEIGGHHGLGQRLT